MILDRKMFSKHSILSLIFPRTILIVTAVLYHKYIHIIVLYHLLSHLLDHIQIHQIDHEPLNRIIILRQTNMTRLITDILVILSQKQKQISQYKDTFKQPPKKNSRSVNTVFYIGISIEN